MLVNQVVSVSVAAWKLREVRWVQYLHEVGCGPDAHASHRLPLASGEAAVAGTLAGERAERVDPGGHGKHLWRPGRTTLRFFRATESSTPRQRIHNLSG